MPVPLLQRMFGPPEAWTQDAFHGGVATYFANLAGEGSADAVAIDPNGILVRANLGDRFAVTSSVWAVGPFVGAYGTLIANVFGGPFSAVIAVTDNSIVVRQSDGQSFLSADIGGNFLPSGPFYGTRGTYFADVTGDGRADAIAVNDDTVRCVGIPASISARTRTGPKGSSTGPEVPTSPT
jgi:hypothetical protein